MRLQLDEASVARARALAAHACQPVLELAQAHTTVSIERAVLRMAGLTGADVDGTPWVNRMVDSVAEQVGLEHGVALPVWDTLRARTDVGSADPLRDLAQDAAAGTVRWRVPTGRSASAARTAAMRAARRNPAKDRDIGSGPGKLSQALGITGDFDGADLVTGDAGFQILDDGTPPPRTPVTATRVGISRAREHPWRWYVPGNPHVSRK